MIWKIVRQKFKRKMSTCVGCLRHMKNRGNFLTQQTYFNCLLIKLKLPPKKLCDSVRSPSKCCLFYFKMEEVTNCWVLSSIGKKQKFFVIKLIFPLDVADTQIFTNLFPLGQTVYYILTPQKGLPRHTPQYTCTNCTSMSHVCSFGVF